jgi:SAM-dependent methyltransferase
MENELIRYLEKNKDKYILSMDGMEDQIAPKLAQKKFMHTHCIGLSKEIYNKPFYYWIKYQYCDPEDTHYPDAMFDIIYKSGEFTEKFIVEAARILDTNGVLILDKRKRENYAPSMEKLFVSDKLNIKNKEIVIFRLIKPKPKKLPKQINVIIKPFKKFEGTYIQVEVMKKRLEEKGVKVNLYKNYWQAPKKDITIIEWEAGLNQPIPKDPENMIEAHTFITDYSNMQVIMRKMRPVYLLSLMKPSTLYYYFKYYMVGGQVVGNKKSTSWKEFNKEMEKHILLSRTYEMAVNNKITKHLVMPHFATITTKEMERKVLPIDTKKELHIGTFGHSAASKHFEDICKLAIRLDIKCTIMGSINELHIGSIAETSTYAAKIYNKYNNANKGKIKVKIGQWTYPQLRRELSKCTHLISAQDQARSVSNSMRFMVSIGRPLISVENYQAREVQALRVNSLYEIDRELLENSRTMLTNLDDGLRYALCILRMFPDKKHIRKYLKK